MPQARIAQECRGFIQPPLQNMMREALAGFLEKQMHITWRNAEQRRDRGYAQSRIAATAFNLAQNGQTTRLTDAVLSCRTDRRPPKSEGRQIDNMIADELRGPAISQMFDGNFLQISK